MHPLGKSYGFFYQSGAYGRRYGRYLAHVDPAAAERFGDRYIGDCIAEQYERDERERICWGYTGECLRALTRGAVGVRLIDLISDRDTPAKAVTKQDTRTTEEITAGIIAGLSAILEKGEGDV